MGIILNILYNIKHQNIKHQNTKKSISKTRLVAGLGEILLIPELQQSSNALITVNFSLDEGKDLYCVPSRITENNYCNYLIRQGAELVINAEDIFRNLY